MTATLTPIRITASRPRSIFRKTPIPRNRCLVFLWLGIFGFVLDADGATDPAFFTYTDNGTSLTITGYSNGADEPTDVEIPAFIDIDADPEVVNEKPVTALANFAFYYRPTLTSVIIPEGVTSIGTYAFYYCNSITSVQIPSSVTTIMANAFLSCSSLNSITIPNSGATIGNAAFANCSSLASLTLPSGLTAVPEGLCDTCSSLTSLTIPAGVTTIGKQAFRACSSLVEVTIPPLVTSIGDKAFYACTSLERADFTGNAPTLAIIAPAETTNVFGAVTPGFNVRYFAGLTGYTTPLWYGYPTSEIPVTDPVTNWLTAHSLPTNSDMLSDDNHDGVKLLMAYALNLNPNQNLSGSLPQPVFGVSQMSLDFYAGAVGVTYVVETCTNFEDWTTTGVSLSTPDENQIRTATVDMTGPSRYMRLKVSD